MTELEFQKAVLNRLSPFFHIKEQVTGVHFTGVKKRIDAIITPKDSQLWANPSIAFGIEFKRPDAWADVKVVSKMIRQAYDYLHTDFEEHGKIPILVCPLKIQDVYCSANEMRFIKRLIGRFGMGEIINHPFRGISIVFQNEHFVWSEKEGLMNGAHQKFDFSGY